MSAVPVHADSEKPEKNAKHEQRLQAQVQPPAAPALKPAPVELKPTPESPKPAPTRPAAPARGVPPTPVRNVNPPTPVPPTPVPPPPATENAPADEAPPPVAPPPVPATAVPAVVPPPVRAVAPAAAATPTEEPTVEPTVAIVDVSQDRNARLANTPAPRTPTAVPPTAVPTPEPTAVVSSDQDLMGSVVAASMEPLLFGGRVGLILGGAGAAGYFLIQRLRRR